MKKIVFALLLLPSIIFAQNGIKFQTGKTWAQLKAEAKSSNKLIFLDAFTSWCGPCKAMAKDVFTLQSVGEVFNTKFINAKIDMEIGEGVNIAQEYKVAAYPTLLFIDGNGKLIHKVLGYKTGPALLDAAKNSSDPFHQYSALVEAYDKGTIAESSLKNLVDVLDDAGDSEKAAEVVAKVLQKNKNWMDEPQLGLVVKYTLDIESDQFKFLSDNEEKISKISGYEEISDQLNRIVRTAVVQKTLNTGTNVLDLVAAKSLFIQYRKVNGEKLYYLLLMDYAIYKSDKGLIEEAGNGIGKFAADLSAEELNSIAWKFFENFDKKETLETALNWALLSVKKKNGFFNNDTVANLYNKLGDKVKAKKYAQEAIKLGNADGEDVSATEDLLKTL
jgi:thiol-disulfide isomerase/thioredoxin